MNSFSILSHLNQLVPVEGKSTATTGEYHCPVCNAENFKVDLKTGKYNAFGCDCMATAAGKQRVIDAISPATWEKPPRKADSHTYTYDTLTNGVAESIAQVCRKDDGQGHRQFYQQHWDGHRWAKGLPDDVKAAVHLFRIFCSVNERAKGGRIFLVEGEGKVNALLSKGIPATCAIGGAGKWKQYGYPNYLEDLKGYQVVLCPDRDEPGVKHCEEIEADLVQNGITVAGWCYAFPESFLWQRLPKSGGADVVDWIADGATKETILDAVEPRRLAQPPEPEPTDDQGFDLEERHCSMRVNYHRVKQQVGDRLRFNQLTKRIELDGEALDLDDLQVSLAVNHNIQVPDAQFQKIVSNIARDNAYSPVAEYLDQVAQTHGNSTAILDDLATRYLGTDHPLHNTYIRKTLIAAVARAYVPGCQVDTACILQGGQGDFKSTFFKTLASREWFDDSMGSSSDKDERLKLHMVWFVEWAELEAVFKRKDVATVKAFITCSRDLVRPPYGRETKELDRPSIFVGTTNEKEFLADSTGNRRFWVIPVRREIDTTTLQQERDAIWAAAVAAYRAGEKWWLTKEEQAQSNELNQEYAMQDPWHEVVATYVSSMDASEVTTKQILDHALRIDLDKQDRRAQMRVSTILKQLGWTSKLKRVGGVPTRIWFYANEEKKSFFGEVGCYGCYGDSETTENQGFEGVTTSVTTSPERLLQVVTPTPETTPTVTTSPPRNNPVTTRNNGGLLHLNDGIPTVSGGCNNRNDLQPQPLEDLRWPHVGQPVRKVGKRGWRGEIVRMVSTTHVDVQWAGDKHPS
ncbi:VapE domain-containing protein, partial [Phormidium sp. FACHB-1136]|uniref:VapE domain-containing protein n=1 Tax=Phormidium sp. FACHB-1136 TaxID=2692848 RepID=UPI001685091E